MPIISDDNLFKDGFLWGQYERMIDETSRLRLGRDIIDVLNERSIKQLWRCPDPTGQRFILCPPEHHDRFIGLVRTYVTPAPESEEAWRLLCSGTERPIDSQGRIRISVACLRQAKIRLPQQVTVLGVGYWYEVTAWTSASKD